MAGAETPLEGVDWSQQYGAQCPLCGVFTRLGYKYTPWIDGIRMRYHVCPNDECGHRFKSVEVDRARLSVSPSPDQLRFVQMAG